MIFRFGDFALDTERRDLSGPNGPVALEPQVFDLLEFVIKERGRVVTRDDLLGAVWGGRLVSDSAIASRINAARAAIGDDGTAQRFIRTIPHKGFRFVADVSADGAAGMPRQEIKYLRAADGLRLAYATVGSGPPLLKAANYLNHLEFDWESPVTGHLLRSLASVFTLTRYDARGNGLSDWDVDNLSIDAWVSDLEHVSDAVGLKRFPLFGMSQGCAIAITYAVRHPERVSHLILYGGYARGRLVRATTDAERARLAAVETLIRTGWGEQHPMFRQLFTSMFVPDGTREHLDWFNELQRRSTSPDCAARYFRVFNGINVSTLLPKVRTPTLVLHLREDAAFPFSLGQEIAAGIPGARLVALRGKNHMPLEHDPDTPRILEEMRLFLGV